MTMDTLPSVKEALIREGLWAKKSFGQHFLLDLEITRRIVALAGDVRSQTVLEIGPGPGGLTRALIEAGAHVIAIEKDRRFAPLLEEIAAHAEGRLRVVEGDALDIDYAALLDSARARIVANLPYNVGTPLLVSWLKADAWRGAMTLMFQREVGERIVARVGREAYGRLAVLAQAVCTARIVMHLAPRAFTPPPKVASVVVQLEDRADRFDDLTALETVTAAAFGQRRKMLRSSLKALGDAEALCASASLDPTARAETIDVAGFCRLARAWRAIQ
jgi:16S rRNA (adenine1518-N6/adenine1519-N6)-dimethyltransferase